MFKNIAAIATASHTWRCRKAVNGGYRDLTGGGLYCYASARPEGSAPESGGALRTQEPRISRDSSQLCCSAMARSSGSIHRAAAA
ncbi:hypothetical protein [Paenibacillus sp. FSL M7-0420]|uniref:hypothetical protein n=1 Tax=Paenibacillus sp. FSL M7-0420 TaxID=2921609 RepID=UPI0030F60520